MTLAVSAHRPIAMYEHEASDVGCSTDDDVVPKTAVSFFVMGKEPFDPDGPPQQRNFRELATGQNGYGYEGSTFHRVIPNCAFACRRSFPTVH